MKSTAQKTGEKDLMLVPGGGTEYTYEGTERACGGLGSPVIVRQPAAPEWRAFGSVDIEPERQDRRDPVVGTRHGARHRRHAPRPGRRRGNGGCVPGPAAARRGLFALSGLGLFAVAVLVLIAARSEVAPQVAAALTRVF